MYQPVHDASRLKPAFATINFYDVPSCLDILTGMMQSNQNRAFFDDKRLINDNLELASLLNREMMKDEISRLPSTSHCIYDFSMDISDLVRCNMPKRSDAVVSFTLPLPPSLWLHKLVRKLWHYFQLPADKAIAEWTLNDLLSWARLCSASDSDLNACLDCPLAEDLLFSIFARSYTLPDHPRLVFMELCEACYRYAEEKRRQEESRYLQQMFQQRQMVHEAYEYENRWHRSEGFGRPPTPKDHIPLNHRAYQKHSHHLRPRKSMNNFTGGETHFIPDGPQSRPHPYTSTHEAHHLHRDDLSQLLDQRQGKKPSMTGFVSSSNGTTRPSPQKRRVPSIESCRPSNAVELLPKDYPHTQTAQFTSDITFPVNSHSARQHTPSPPPLYVPPSKMMLVDDSGSPAAPTRSDEFSPTEAPCPSSNSPTPFAMIKHPLSSVIEDYSSTESTGGSDDKNGKNCVPVPISAVDSSHSASNDSACNASACSSPRGWSNISPEASRLPDIDPSSHPPAEHTTFPAGYHMEFDFESRDSYGMRYQDRTGRSTTGDGSPLMGTMMELDDDCENAFNTLRVPSENFCEEMAEEGDDDNEYEETEKDTSSSDVCVSVDRDEDDTCEETSNGPLNSSQDTCNSQSIPLFEHASLEYPLGVTSASLNAQREAKRRGHW